MNFGELDILHYKVLTKTIEDYADDKLIGINLFPEQRIDGITAKWDILSPSRTKGLFRNPGEPATKIELMKVATQFATCIPMLLEKVLDEATLAWLRQPGEATQNNARAHITRELQDMAKMVDRAKEYAIWQALTGSLAIDQDNVKVSVDYAFSTDPDHTPDASATWATGTNENILTDLRTWKKRVEEDSGYTATDVYCNDTVMEHILTNDEVIAYLGEGRYKEQIAQSGYITNLMGLTFHVYNKGYINSAGTFVPYIADDYIVMIAKDAPFGYVQVGTQEIPISFSETDKVSGRFAYSVAGSNPPEIKVFLGENFLPVVTVPNAIIYANTTPA